MFTIGKWQFGGKRIITDDPDNPLMIRWKILRTSTFGIFIHKFCRSDHERALHDHPWSFVSIILKGGYKEIFEEKLDHLYGLTAQYEEWRRPGSILIRPATWKHRVILEPGKTSWSLVFVSGRTRKWGFWPGGKWCWWRTYNHHTGICEEEPIFDGNND